MDAIHVFAMVMKICQLACVTSKLVNVFVQITQKGMSVKSAKRDSMVPQGMAAFAITCVQPNPSLKVSQTLKIFLCDFK
jgi:hypothetical protein